MRKALLFLCLLPLAAAADDDGLNGEIASPPPASAPAPIPVPAASGAPADSPDLTGVPEAPADAPLVTSDEVRAAPGGDDPGCRKLDPALRALVFRHYRNTQEMQLKQGQALPDGAPVKAAHLLGMVLKESAGDPTDVTDMKGHEVGTYRAMSSLQRWQDLFSHSNLTYNKQTNYGLAQQSMDRIVATNDVSPKVTAFFKGNVVSGRDVRKLIAIYQDFAQGRLKPGDPLIPESALKDPKAADELKSRSREGLQAAVWHCGTRFLFKEGYMGAEGEKQLEDAMASIAYCDFGEKQPDLSNDAQAKCFARWITLCPALNLDIALLSPDSYFQTRNATPACQQTFQKLTLPEPKAPGNG